MTQIINVRGIGPVEFPDGMDDAAIIDAIKNNLPTEDRATRGTIADKPLLTRQGEVHPPASVAAAVPQAPAPGEASVPKPPQLEREKAGGIDWSKGKSSPGESSLSLVEKGATKILGDNPADTFAEEPIPVLDKDGKLSQASLDQSMRQAGNLMFEGGLKGVKSVFAPHAVDAPAGRAAASIRREGGLAARDTEITRAALEPHQKTVRNLNDPMPLYDFLENQSKGTKHIPPELVPVASKIKGELAKRRHIMEQMPSLKNMNFIEDYYPHLWEDPAQASAFVHSRMGGKEGSGKFTKARSIPTIADGIAAGLTPKYGPLETVQHYVNNADRFIATNTVFDTARKVGDVKYFPPGKAPPDWVEVESPRLGTKTTPVGPMKAYAPEGWARVYNNYVGKGIHESRDLGNIYDATRRVSNAATQMELGLSAYHGLTMAQETIVHGLATGLDAMARGKPVTAARLIGKAVTLTNPITYARKGAEMKSIYSGKSPGSPEAKRIVDIVTKAGGRMAGNRHAPDYEMSGTGNYFDAWKTGALKGQLRGDFGKALSNPLSIPGLAIKHIGRTLQTISKPIFEHYIPSIKNGAAFESISTWLETHPHATEAEIMQAARGIVDSIDNRFGEMIQDNVFLPKLVKQAGMLGLRSWSWNFGFGREFGGGLMEAAGAPKRAFDKVTGSPSSKPNWTPKMSYVVALPITYAYLAGIYQYLKTGEPPKDMTDLMAPRTGGTVPPSNKYETEHPERLLIPGFMKDVFGFAEHPMTEAGYKVGALPTLAYRTATILDGMGGEDWRGDPILNPPAEGSTWLSNVPGWLVQYMQFAGNSIGVPISLKSAMGDPKIGSNISTPERAIGVRNAPPFLENPSHEATMDYLRRKGQTDKERYQEKQAVLRGQPMPEKSGTGLPEAQPKKPEEYVKFDKLGSLWKEAESYGIKVNHNWSADTLHKKIAAARAAREGSTYKGTQ